MTETISEWPKYCLDSAAPKLHSLCVEANSRRCGDCGHNNPYYIETTLPQSPTIKIEAQQQSEVILDQASARRESLSRQTRSNTIDLGGEESFKIAAGRIKPLEAAEVLRQESIRKKPGSKSLLNQLHAGRIAISNRALGTGSTSDAGLLKKLIPSCSILVVIVEEVFRIVDDYGTKELVELKEISK
jgi:hypothetical protein